MKPNLQLITAMALFLNGSIAMASLVEGGRVANSEDPNLLSVVKLRDEKTGKSFCTGTFITKKCILTSAHCVVGDNGEDQLGESFSNWTSEIYIHPKYQDFVDKNIKKNRISSELHSSETERFDLALIKLKEDDKFITNNNLFSIVTPATEFTQRGDLSFIGAGATEHFYQAGLKNWLPIKAPEGDKLCVGVNSWNPSENLKSVEKLMPVMSKLYMPSFNSKYTHVINDDGLGTKYLIENKSGKSTALQGDSGSGIVEKDKFGKSTLTAVVSMGNNSVENFKLIIKTPIGIETVEIKPKNLDSWLSSDKRNIDIPQITNELRKRGLLNKGILTAGVSVERRFDRISTSYATDLLLPENQEFLKKCQ